MRSALAPVVAWLLLAAAPARAAAAAKLDMSWQAPSGCPAYSDVESWLQAVIPPDARERLAELHVKVSISGNANTGFSANVRVTREGSDAAETRVVEGRACEEVARSAIVVVSVAMSDALKAEPAAAAPPPVAEPKPAPTTPVVATPAVLATPSDRPELPAVAPPTRWLLGAAAGVGSGFAEQPGIRADARLLYGLTPSLLLGPRVHALPSVTVRRDDDVAELHFVSGGLELCFLPTLTASLRLGACGRAEAGVAWARGSQSKDPSDSGPVASLALTPSASFGQRVRLVLEGDFELRLLRPRFETAGGDVLARLPVVAGSGLVGVALALP